MQINAKHNIEYRIGLGVHVGFGTWPFKFLIRRYYTLHTNYLANDSEFVQSYPHLSWIEKRVGKEY